MASPVFATFSLTVSGSTCPRTTTFFSSTSMSTESTPTARSDVVGQPTFLAFFSVPPRLLSLPVGRLAHHPLSRAPFGRIPRILGRSWRRAARLPSSSKVALVSQSHERTVGFPCSLACGIRIDWEGTFPSVRVKRIRTKPKGFGSIEEMCPRHLGRIHHGSVPDLGVSSLLGRETGGTPPKETYVRWSRNETTLIRDRVDATTMVTKQMCTFSTVCIPWLAAATLPSQGLGRRPSRGFEWMDACAPSITCIHSTTTRCPSTPHVPFGPSRSRDRSSLWIRVVRGILWGSCLLGLGLLSSRSFNGLRTVPPGSGLDWRTGCERAGGEPRTVPWSPLEPSPIDWEVETRWKGMDGTRGPSL